MDYRLVSKETCAKVGNAVVSVIVFLFVILAMCWKWAD